MSIMSPSTLAGYTTLLMSPVVTSKVMILLETLTTYRWSLLSRNPNTANWGPIRGENCSPPIRGEHCSPPITAHLVTLQGELERPARGVEAVVDGHQGVGPRRLGVALPDESLHQALATLLRQQPPCDLGTQHL